MICPVCKTKYEGNYCPNGCNSPFMPKKRKKNKPGFWFIAAVVTGSAVMLILLLSGMYSVMDLAGVVDVEPASDIRVTYAEQSLTPADEQYVSQCEEIDYKKLNDDPEIYIGRQVRLMGDVMQVIEYAETDEGSRRVDLRVNVSGDDDFAANIVYVVLNVDAETEFDSGDTVTVYGISEGLRTFKTDFGSNTELPEVDALYYDVWR